MSKFTRRDFIHASCTIAGASLVPHFMDRARAGLRLHGSASAPSGLSQRTVLNLNDFGFETNDYPMINHLLPTPGVTPADGHTGFTSGKTWPAVLDANGWPDDAAANGQQWQLKFAIPDPANFPGPYRMDWVGNGEIDIHFFNNTGGTPTFANNINCADKAGNTFVWVSTGGASTASVDLTFSATSPSGPVFGTLDVTVTGTSGFFVKNIRLYRVSDAADLAAGLMWRRGWKQPIVGLCPSAIRFMNLVGGNSDPNVRFENRTLPSHANYMGGTGTAVHWTASPCYQTAATGINQYVVAAADGVSNPSNPQTTPASMVHGEIATVLFTNAIARVASPQISSVTNATNGVVTTASAHGYNTGDIIIHQINLISFISGNLNSNTSITSVSDVSQLHVGMFVIAPGVTIGTTITNISGTTLTISSAATITLSSGHLSFRSMNNLHLFPCTITVTGSTTYQLNVDTTGFGAFFTSSAGARAMQFVTAQVGSGNDRTPYPICLGDIGTPIALNGSSTFLDNNSYKTLSFDKTVFSQTDGSGNPVPGVWTIANTPSQGYIGHGGDFPIEACVALVNELNAMSPAHVIGMWMNIPAKGLSTMDPDYTTASDWAVNAVDVVMNPSSTVRASGYSALGYSGATQLNQPPLIIEDSNEIWNGINQNAFGWLASRAQLRWPSVIGLNNNYGDMHALRSACMARDVKASNPPNLSRIKFVIGMWGSRGLLPGDGGQNYATTFGGNITATPVNYGDWYINDTLVTGGGWGRPIDNHDGVSPATYFDPPAAYFNTRTGTGVFTDDSAMFNGTDNSGTLSMTGGTGGVASTTLTITAVAAGTPVVNQPLVGTGITSPATVVTAVSGISPNFTLTLSQAANVANGTTIKAPSNGGGNYAGAANQSQAITNFVAKVVDAGNTGGGQSIYLYQNVLIPQYVSTLATQSPGKIVLSYEGGTDWAAQGGTAATASYNLTGPDAIFSIAVIDSSQWATAQVGFFTATGSINGYFMPAIYTWIGAQNLVTTAPSQRWAYCQPDSYATISGTPTEGAALTVNSPVWIAMGNYNQTLPN